MEKDGQVVAERLIEFKIVRGTVEKAKSLFGQLVRRKFKNNFANLQPYVEDSVDRTITRNKERFIPTDDEAAQLGIGMGGAIRRDKTQAAWKLLSPKHPTTVMTIKVVAGIGGNGTVSIKLNTDRWFDAPECNIEVSNTIFTNIPWMEWFIDGQTVVGARFSAHQPIPKTSRTGAGIMIRGGLWVFLPKVMRLLDTMDEVRADAVRAIKSRGAKIIPRRGA